MRLATRPMTIRPHVDPLSASGERELRGCRKSLLPSRKGEKVLAGG